MGGFFFFFFVYSWYQNTGVTALHHITVVLFVLVLIPYHK